MMEWEEHLREMAQTAVEHPEYKMLAWFTARDAVAEIDRLRSEITRLTAELKEREGEVERLQDEVRDACGYAHDMESLAASRLADQEAIERHVTKRVAGECAEIAQDIRTTPNEGCETHCLGPCGPCAATAIRKKYGVE